MSTTTAGAPLGVGVVETRPAASATDSAGDGAAQRLVDAILGNAQALRAASDADLGAVISSCLGTSSARRGVAIPVFSVPVVYALVLRLCDPPSALAVVAPSSAPATTATADARPAAAPEAPPAQPQQPQPAATNDGAAMSAASAFYCSQQLKWLIANLFAAAARAQGFAIDPGFQATGPASELPPLIALMLDALIDERLSLEVGEVMRLFLQHSPAFLQAFVAFRLPPQPDDPVSQPATARAAAVAAAAATTSAAPQTAAAATAAAASTPFRRTAFGVIAPLLTDMSALRNHAAWQILFAALQSDPDTLRPTREAVELLSRHLHAFLDLLITCLRHANPASRRFTLRLLSDISQLHSDWIPISHCILQSPAMFFALLANAEGPPGTPEHWPVYHILKMFISFPGKCPLMRHMCFINRDALSQYAQACAVRFAVPPRETEMLLSKLAAMTPLSAEDAALIHCTI